MDNNYDEKLKTIGWEGLSKVFNKDHHILVEDYKIGRDDIVIWLRNNCETIYWCGLVIYWIGDKTELYHDLITMHTWKITRKDDKGIDYGYQLKRNDMLRLVLFISNFDLIFVQKSKNQKIKDLYMSMMLISEIMTPYKNYSLSYKIDTSKTLNEYFQWVLNAVLNKTEDLNLILSILNKN